MSLITFVSRPEVAAKLVSLHPKFPKRIPTPIQVPPRSTRYSLIGTAFDYLLRFELQRRTPNATATRWVAEYAPAVVRRTVGGASVERDLLQGTDSNKYLPPVEVAKRMGFILTSAKAAVAAFVERMTVTRADVSELAAHAIRLAKLDVVYRAMRLAPDFESAGRDDIEELADLLALTPFNELPLGGRVLLNPSFGQASESVDGADADLIASGVLVDIKTTKKNEIETANLNQLLGYLLLARRQRTLDRDFPEINHLALYFSRHGHFWTKPASEWTSAATFPEVERWFWEQAERVHPPTRTALPS